MKVSLDTVLAVAVHAVGIETVGLLGTRFTMEESFWPERMRRHGVEVVVPGAEDREFVHPVIYDELYDRFPWPSPCACRLGRVPAGQVLGTGRLVPKRGATGACSRSTGLPPLAITRRCR